MVYREKGRRYAAFFMCARPNKTGGKPWVMKNIAVQQKRFDKLWATRYCAVHQVV